MGGVGVNVSPAGSWARDWVTAAVLEGGGVLAEPEEAEVLVWTEANAPDDLAALISGPAAGVRWVQLPWAGIEPYVEVLDDRRIWTCGKGVYADPVAELALTLLLAGLRGLGRYARATEWTTSIGENLLGAPVTILGGGGITESLLRLLGPFGCEVTVVRRRPAAMPGATHVVGSSDPEIDAAIAGSRGLVVALALTPETRGIVDGRRLRMMDPAGWLVNVARGAHVVTDDLVEVLRERTIGGAGLDVTDPEPLPAGHPLWTFERCLITPHAGNTPRMAVPLLSARIRENLQRWAAGEPLLGLVDVAAGY